jgi:hypothetical protein
VGNSATHDAKAHDSNSLVHVSRFLLVEFD